MHLLYNTVLYCSLYFTILYYASLSHFHHSQYHSLTYLISIIYLNNFYKRIGTGFLVILSFTFSLYSKLSGISYAPSNLPNTPLSATTPASTSTYLSWVFWIIHTLLGQEHMVVASDLVATDHKNPLVHYRPVPSSNLLTVLMPAFMIAMISKSLRYSS